MRHIKGWQQPSTNAELPTYILWISSQEVALLCPPGFCKNSGTGIVARSYWQEEGPGKNQRNSLMMVRSISQALGSPLLRIPIWWKGLKRIGLLHLRSGN